MSNQNSESPFAQVPHATSEWLEKMGIKEPTKKTVKEATENNGKPEQ